MIIIDSIFRHHHLIDDNDDDNWTIKLESTVCSLFKTNANTNTNSKGIIIDSNDTNTNTNTRTIRDGDFSKLRTFFD